MGVYKAFKVAACGDDNGFVYEDFMRVCFHKGFCTLQPCVTKLRNPKPTLSKQYRSC